MLLHCFRERLSLLQESELGELDENPEQFHHQAVDVGAWQDNLRTCAENLFALLISVGSPSPRLGIILTLGFFARMVYYAYA
jgi:hypothetical protein